jgi:predicted transcriptional regulator
MVKTTVYLDDADVRSLRAMSKSRAKPQAELVREAIHAFTAQERAPLPAGLGMFDSGETGTTSNRKKILRDAALAGRWRS